MGRLARIADAAIVALPGALVVYLSFHGGGFFAGAPALAAVVLAAALVLHLTLAPNPFAGISRPFALAACALGGYAAWTLASAAWSNAPARALVEFDRALLYLLALVLFGLVPRTARRTAWTARLLALGIAIVCGSALVTRVAPDVWPIRANIASQRLSYPLTYWNALALLAAVGIVLCLHMTSSSREPPAARILAAAALPVLATTLLFTFSRGGIVATAAAVLVYAIAGNSRTLLTGVAATAAPTAVAVLAAYGADRLARPHPTSPAAVAQGHHLALVIGICVLAAAGLRALLLAVDARLASVAVSTRARRLARAAPAVALLLAVVVATSGFDFTHRIGRQYDRFVHDSSLPYGSDPRARLSDPGNNGRLDYWRVALHVFSADQLRGSGAGTYANAWAQRRHIARTVVNAHSLYLETLSDLGLVGLLLLAVALGAVGAGFAARARSPARPLYVALLAAAVAWALDAGVDWIWQMPAATVWLFALAGAALAAPRRAGMASGTARPLRVVAGVGVLVVAVTPATLAVSQTRLDTAVRAFKRGDCRSTVGAALGAIDAVPVRPEPWELVGFCDARLGAPRLAVAALERARQRDPRNWEVHYGLAIVEAASGLDPRGEASLARRLNPLDPRARRAADLFSARDRARWSSLARSLPLPV